MRVKDEFFKRGSFNVVNGLHTRFWEDTWLGNKPLAEQYPSLFNIVRHKNVVVAQVLANNPLNVEFRRALTGDRWISWLKLVEKIMDVNLSDNDDVFLWRLTNTKKFTVSSMYSDFMHGHNPFLRKYLWKLKVCLKIKIFMWFVQRKVVLTKDNLIRRHWAGSKKCAFFSCG